MKSGKVSLVFNEQFWELFLYFRFKNQILCDLHFADVALMECSDFMQQLRSFKPQSLGCAVARRKSSTTLIFPLPPQACSGKCFRHRYRDRPFFLSLIVGLHFCERAQCHRLLEECICMRWSYRWFRLSWITHDYMSEVTSSRRIRIVECKCSVTGKRESPNIHERRNNNRRVSSVQCIEMNGWSCVLDNFKAK